MFSLVDVHTSSGVERTQQEIMRHLRASNIDHRISGYWSYSENIAVVEMVFNSEEASENGNITPFHMKFGSDDTVSCNLPATSMDSSIFAEDFFQSLDSNLSEFHRRSDVHRVVIQEERSTKGTSLAQQNILQAGDLVLFFVILMLFQNINL